MMKLGIMIDTETTNGFDDPMAYDVGWQVIDTRGNIYKERSFVNADIFLDDTLMENAYFKDKIPGYWEDIKQGKRILTNTYRIKEFLKEDVENYECEFICAHNARFDYKSLHKTQRYITKSKYRWFVPYGLEWWDTLKMSRDYFSRLEDYKEFCEVNGYMTSRGIPRYTAEIVYRYISRDLNFIEKHTGLEDVDIERQILAYILSHDEKVDRLLW